MSHHVTTADSIQDIITIWPHRSLSPRGFTILLGALSAIAFAAGTAFFIIGAWPVIGFLGLEFGVLYFAFKYNYRAAKAYEQLLIHKSGIDIIRICAKGTKQQTSLGSLWLKAEIQKLSGRRKILGLRLHSEFHEIGAFLPPAEKTHLKELINQRIEQARLA